VQFLLPQPEHIELRPNANVLQSRVEGQPGQPGLDSVVLLVPALNFVDAVRQRV
jgi:hypothetical protein